MRISYIDGTLSVIGGISGELGIPKAVDIPPYDGEYTVTPSEVTQVLATDALRMTDDVVINPIPDHYGRISWDGATLRVY